MTVLSENLKLYPQINYRHTAQSKRLNKSILNSLKIIVRMTLGKELFWSQCSIDLIGRKPHTEPRVALFCMFHVWVYAGSRQQASLLRLFVNICRGIKSQASGWKGRRQNNKVSPRGSNILWKITEPWHLFFISPPNLCLWCLMAPA